MCSVVCKAESSIGDPSSPPYCWNASPSVAPVAPVMVGGATIAHCCRQPHLVFFSLCEEPNIWVAWLLISAQKFSKEMFWPFCTPIFSRSWPRASSFSADCNSKQEVGVSRDVPTLICSLNCLKLLFSLQPWTWWLVWLLLSVDWSRHNDCVAVVAFYSLKRFSESIFMITATVHIINVQNHQNIFMGDRCRRSKQPEDEGTRRNISCQSAKQNFYFPRAQQYWSGGGASGTFATTGNCLDTMVWNWVVVMVGPSSAALWNSVTKALMASSNSEYWQSNNRQQVRYNNWLGRHGNQQLSSLTEQQGQSYNGVSSPTETWSSFHITVALIVSTTRWL